MKELEYRTINKAEWGDGPWVTEPDKAQWQDPATGYACLIVRGPTGALCGYVGVSETHPLHNVHYDKAYDAFPDYSLSVHGGLTFSDFCVEAPTPESWEKFKARGRRAEDEAKRYPRGDSARFLRERALELQDYDAYVKHSEAANICHKVEPGEDDRVWWLGFDAAHSGDLSPKYAKEYPVLSGRGETYRDFGYLKNEVTQLAAQLHAFEHSGRTAEEWRHSSKLPVETLRKPLVTVMSKIETTYFRGQTFVSLDDLVMNIIGNEDDNEKSFGQNTMDAIALVQRIFGHSFEEACDRIKLITDKAA